MENLKECQAFCDGVAAGVNIFQQVILASYERKLPISIDGNLYYIQDGAECLQEAIDEMCR